MTSGLPSRFPTTCAPGSEGLPSVGRRIHDSAVGAFGTDGLVGSAPACPHCGGEFHVAKAESTRYLLCEDCGLVRMLPFAALNPGSALLDPFPRPTAV